MSDKQASGAQPNIDLAALQAIEADGAAATKDLAHMIVREVLEHKGKVDLVRLDRVGPSVRTEVLRLLAEAAASRPSEQTKASPPSRHAHQREPADPSVKKKKKTVSPKPMASPSARRATKEWRAHCRDARSFRSDAYRFGFAIAMTIGVIAMGLLLLLNI